MREYIGMKNINCELRKMLAASTSDLEKAVLEECLSETEPECFIDGVLKWGCVSGSVGSLIYYSDTHKFYDKHYCEIEELREDYENNNGIPIKITGDLKNYLAWFAFEETLYRIAGKIGIV